FHVPSFRSRARSHIFNSDLSFRRPTRGSAVSARLSLPELQAKTKVIRKHIITSTTTAGSGHPTSSLSAVEIATALYFGGVLRYDPKKPHWPQRDRFVISKGHAAPLLYAVLAEAGYFPKEQLQTLRKLDSPLE